MALSGMRVGQQGFYIEVTIMEGDAAKDISGYDTFKIYLINPSQSVTPLTASFSDDGTDGKVKATIGAGVLDEAGDWELQATYGDGGSVVIPSSLANFKVGRSLFG